MADQLTDSEAKMLRQRAIKHRLCHFVQGEDGFGGENAADERALKFGSELLLAAKERTPRWIPVSERLPKDSEPVLFGWWNTPRGSVVSHYCAELGMHRAENGYWEAERTAPQDEPIRFTDDSEQVTHWMELPKPPTDDGIESWGDLFEVK